MNDSAPMASRLAFPLILACSLIVALVYYVGATQGMVPLLTGIDNNLVGAPSVRTPKGPAALKSVSAVAVNPMDQAAVNGVIAARARATGNLDRALQETELLRRLGWRSTSSLQNLLWRGGMTRDLPLLMDTMDALLRRQKLLSEIYPILNLMTTEAEFRSLLTRRLAGRPSWRRYYFLSASDLAKPQEIEGRYFVMRDIQRGGDRLTRNEIAPILPKLIAIGQTPRAFELWRMQDGTATTPLADTDFTIAAKPLTGDALPISFEWQLGSGSGYVVDAGRDERGSFASIDWNGRGAPTFMSQRTTGRAGRYRLDVEGEPPMSAVADRVGFRLVCANGGTTEFRPIGDVGGGRRMRLIGNGRSDCDFPELQLYGLVQTGTTSASVVLRRIGLQRVGP